MTATDALDNPSYFAVHGEAPDCGNAPPGPPVSGQAPSAAPAPAPPSAPAPVRVSSSTKPLLSSLLRRRTRQTDMPDTATGTGRQRSGRGFRSLLRSMGSSTSVYELALGQPRPWDIAPTPTSPTLENCDELDGAGTGPLSPASIGPGSPVSATHPGPPGVSRYYNLTLPLPGSSNVSRRRHSIGTFFHRTPTNKASAPATDVSQGIGVRRGGGTEDDIVLICSGESPAAAQWVSYLTSCFEQICEQRKRPSFRTAHLTLEQVTDGGSEIEVRVRRAKLAVVIVCPALLSRLSSGTGVGSGAPLPRSPAPLGRALRPQRTIAMLLGVSESDVLPSHRAALSTYYEWRRLIVRDQDAAFVGEFLAAAMETLVRVWRSMKDNSADPAPNASRPRFSVHPRKIKQGQGKLIMILNEPLQENDVVEVRVERLCAPGRPGDSSPLVVPGVKRRNPYTLQFSVSDHFLEVSALLGITATRNGENLGSRQVKCESKLRELDRILRANDNPFEFLCQTLGFGTSDRDHLDNFLLSAFQRNVPPQFNLLHIPGLPLRVAQQSTEEYPTLLHFAAHFGLEHLSLQLMDCPGGEQACQIRNCDDLTPADMAAQAGHPHLANTMRGYMQMSEFSNVYTILKNMSEQTSLKRSDVDCTGDPNYLIPRPANETYAVPPAPVALQSMLTQPYLDMSSPGYVKPAANCTNGELRLLYENLPDGIHMEPPDSPVSRQWSERSPVQNNGRQEELLEIIDDFKNNVYTIGEVEKLVYTWQSRNDVQQSYKEKKDQLDRMRGEYERLQDSLQARMRRPSPFDRIRKLFSWSKRRRESAGAQRSSAADGEGTPSSVDATSSTEPVGAGDARERTGAASTRSDANGPPRTSSSLSLHSSCSSTWSTRSSEGHSDPKDYDTPPSPRTLCPMRGALDGALTSPLVTWQHPISPSASEHYVSPSCVRPVPVSAVPNFQDRELPLTPPQSQAAVPEDPEESIENGDSTEASAYVNVYLPSSASDSTSLQSSRTHLQGVSW